MAFPKPLQDLVEQGEKLFSQRSGLMSFWQEVADHFYPERADFTTMRPLGTDFAGHLTTSYPVLARRDLGNAFSSMLRPTNKVWFHVGVRKNNIAEEDRQWLEWAEGTMRRAMFDTATMFSRATKRGDHDYAAFGQCVLTLETNKLRDTLLYRSWHLRDVVWKESEAGQIDSVWRRWKPTVRQLVQHFGKDKLHQSVQTRDEKDPFSEVNCRHIVVPSDAYQSDKRRNTQFVSIYVDLDNEHVIEEEGSPDLIYIIPRWECYESQYAHSPAVVAALPDARLIQEVTFTLLTAGQKFVDPPLIAVKNAIREDVDISAGGITYVDDSYDERLGEVLRPLTQDRHGMPLGMEMAQDIRVMIAEAFFLNKLNMPQRGPAMTAYEVSQRVQEYIRNALPLFAPMEEDYNGQLCDRTFQVLQRNGAFGSPYDLPKGLRGEDIQFRFESPLHDALEAEYAQIFIESKTLIQEAAPLDPFQHSGIRSLEFT